MINFLRKITPKFVFNIYHYVLAILANLFYGKPSEKLIVIGVTGTTGKSTTIHLLSKLLEDSGKKVGVASTIFFKIADEEKINDKKMTMIGRFALQNMLKQMVSKKCDYAIIETTSQGIEQFRHLGINYDIAVFTNLFPEHIEAHGSFENYKNAKLKLFKKLNTEKVKKINGQEIEKQAIFNLDDENVKDFIDVTKVKKVLFTLSNKSSDEGRVIRAEEIITDGNGIKFSVNRQPFAAKLFGQHNVYNALCALAVCFSQGLDLALLSKSLLRVKGVPGRIEFIEEGQSFKVIVDYAFEPKAMGALYEIVKQIPHSSVIHVLGGTGGGRDKSRRPTLGKMAGENARYVIVTNEDPYDEDPQKIIDDVAAGAVSAGKKDGGDLFKVLDRREAIAKAVNLAQTDDIILITGKGSEQAIVSKNNKLIPWDDRQVVREEIKKLLS